MTSVVNYQMTKAAPIIWVFAVSPKPANVKLGSLPGYEATFLLTPDHPDFAEINRICGELAMAEFGTYVGKKFPIKDGTAEADAGRQAQPPRDREFLRGKIMLRAHSPEKKRDGTLANPPRLLVYNKATGKYDRFSEAHERPQVKGMFYSGVMAIGQIGFKAYPGQGGGVTAYLNELVSFNVGDKIITGVDDNERLGDASKYVGHVGVTSHINPMAGAHPMMSAGGPLAGYT